MYIYLCIYICVYINLFSDIIPKEPFISAIELMHIIEAKMKVRLLIMLHLF